MELKIDFKSNEECSVILYDLTEDYLPEASSITVKNKFKYSETSSISILSLNRTDGEVIQKPVFSLHNDHLKDIILNVQSDGWYTINHIILPTKAWFEKEKSKTEGSAINLYDAVYYTDGSNIFKYKDEKIYPSDMKEVTEVNTLDTTIYKIKEDIVSICFLKKCYISLCQEICQDRGFSQCWSRSKVSSESMFKRDTVWMTLNVIKYMVELNQLAEAQRLIENIGGCNGLCREQYDRTGQSLCGCS